MFERILVCLDGSDLAEQILPYATEQALRFGSKVVLLQVVTIPALVAATATPGTGAIVRDELDREAAKARRYLRRAGKALRQKGLKKVVAVVLEGAAGPSIVNYANDNKVDLIALASHGHGGLKRLVFGSVADLVLRESGLPVLVITPQETEK
jgi:nucleotide-binding universal stress UspA family protein